MITIQKSTSGAYFTVTDSSNIARPYVVNDYNFVPAADGVSFSLVSKYKNLVSERYHSSVSDIISNQPYTQIINGDTSSVFADFATLQTYILTNFFRKAGGGSSYTLPVATSSTLGGVKQGSGVSIAGDGTLSSSGGGSPQVEEFPHTIASGSGTEGSPYTHADNTGGIQTKIGVLAAGRGGGIRLASGRFNITTPIALNSSSIKIEGVSAGYNADPNATVQGIKGSTLIVTGSGVDISGTGYPVGRTAAVVLSDLYLYGTTTRQAIGSSTGTIGVKLESFIDQPTLRNVNMGGFDYGVKSVNSSLGWVDFSYFHQVEIQGGRVGVYYDNAGAGNFGQHWISCAIAEQDEHNLYVTAASTNENMVFSGTAFYRGSSATGVANPACIYFAGTKSRFEGCEICQAGYNLINNTHVQADGMILAGSYNTISGCAFLDNQVSGSYGLRISGNNNIVSGCTFNNNSTDILISGNSNIIFAPAGVTITDTGLNNTIIGDRIISKPAVSSSTAAKGMVLAPSLTATLGGIRSVGLETKSTYLSGLGTVFINNAGSSYTNGTYTSVPINSASGGSGGLATVVVATGIVSSVTITTAGIGYTLGSLLTILNSSIGGTGSGFLGYLTISNLANVVTVGLSVDGIDIGSGGGAGYQFNNIAIGLNALIKNTIGGSQGANLALGTSALTANTAGYRNTGIGGQSLQLNTTGHDNVALGTDCLAALVASTTSTGVGSKCLQTIDGNNNTGLGYNAGGSLTSGSGNIYIGASVGNGQTSGSGNTLVGFFTGVGIITGSNNTIVGSQLNGWLSTSVSNNVVIGDGSGNMRFVCDSSGRVYLCSATTYPTIPASSQFTIDNVTTRGTMPWTRVTTTQKNAISSPVESLTVWDTTLHKLCVYNGTTWETVTSV